MVKMVPVKQEQKRFNGINLDRNLSGQDDTAVGTRLGGIAELVKIGHAVKKR